MDRRIHDYDFGGEIIIQRYSACIVGLYLYWAIDINALHEIIRGVIYINI